MGGFGSSRWGWYTPKTTVESCYRLSIQALKPYLCAGMAGKSTWTRGEKTGSIDWRITGPGQPEAIRLIYTITDGGSGAKRDYDYLVPLTYTLTPWGARRYWFTCPECVRRVAVLYLPPGAREFACRKCYHLAYRSSQTKGEGEGVYKLMAASVQDIYPGATAADMRYAFDPGHEDKPPPPGGYYERRLNQIVADYAAWLESLPDSYADYLTAGALCDQSGLTADNLAELEAARLLLPDHDRRYRPKLASWARKLAYLLGEGWTIDELRAWARGRWATANPRAWPPRRDEWSVTSD